MDSCCQLRLQLLQLSGQNLLIHIHHFARRPFSDKFALMKQNHPVTVFDNASHIVCNHQDGRALFADLLHPAVAFGLEEYISYRQSLIYDQNFRIYVDRKSKGQTDKHTAGIGLYRLIDKISDFSKIQNILKLSFHFLPGKPHHSAVHIYIFNSRIIHIKTGSQLQKGGNLAVYIHLPGGWRQHSGDNL